MDDDDKIVDEAEAVDPDGDEAVKDADVYGDGQSEAEEKSPKSPDGGKKESSPKEEDKSARAKNAHEAEQRRLREENARLAKENERLKKAAETAEFNAKKDAVPKDILEDLGLDSVADDGDLALVKAYQDAEANGSNNPARDAYRSIEDQRKAEESKKQKEAEAKSKKEQEDKNALEKLRTDFIKEFGEDDYKKQVISQDSDFWKEWSDVATADNLIPLYRKFKAMRGDDDKEAKTKAKSMGTGYLGGEPNPQTLDTDVMKMSEKEFNEYFKRKYGA